MRKIMNWVLAATLICGASVFTSCTNGNGDNPVVPVEPDLNVAEKIIGKWMVAERDGEPALTNQKTVVTFLSATKGFVSLSRADYDNHRWLNGDECDVKIEGNIVTQICHPQEGVTETVEMNIKSINEKEMLADRKLTQTIDGKDIVSNVYMLKFVRVTADYSTDIIGMWEGHSTGEEGSEFDDGENHRWEYMTDGTFNYFRKVDGQWQISDDDYADYFVDGNLLCTRWKNAGAGNEEHREWWEIESIKDGVMKWKALRQNADGTTYTATFEMKKIDVSSEEEGGGISDDIGIW